MSCAHHWRNCEICGDPIHRGYFCEPCTKKADPWGYLRETVKQATEERDSLHARVRELEGALEDLQRAEAAYRMAHDAHGDGHMIPGRCWDLMRRAGDKARAALAKPEGGAS